MRYRLIEHRHHRVGQPRHHDPDGRRLAAPETGGRHVPHVAELFGDLTHTPRGLALGAGKPLVENARHRKDATPLPVVAGITGEGTRVAEEEAKQKYDAGATAALVYPNHGWLRFGYQKGAPQDRYKAIAQSGLECILFQYPAVTKANYDLDTQLEIAALPGVTATKNGVRDMKRWYDDIPALKNAFPDLAIISCHDEWLLPTMFDIDGLLVGYGNMAPELLIGYLKAGKAQDYKLARKYHEQLLPITRAVYHRGSHMEGSVALKHALRARGLVDNVNVREPLKPLGDGADAEIRAAVKASGLTFVGEVIAA
jgi:4-hydroxy-tetrahydrodipicolinate synthase